MKKTLNLKNNLKISILNKDALFSSVAKDIKEPVLIVMCEIYVPELKDDIVKDWSKHTETLKSSIKTENGSRSIVRVQYKEIESKRIVGSNSISVLEDVNELIPVKEISDEHGDKHGEISAIEGGIKLQESEKLEKCEGINNEFYNMQYMLNISKDFHKSFNGLDNEDYIDASIWEAQMGELNQLYHVQEIGVNGRNYITLVIFLKEFHNSVKAMALSKNKSLKIVDYVNTYHKNMLDILKRNASRKIAQYCSENSLAITFNYDKRAHEVDDMMPPLLADLVQCEIVNDLSVNTESVVYVENGSFHSLKSKGHLKLHSDFSFDWIRNPVNSEILLDYLDSPMIYSNLSFLPHEEKTHWMYKINKEQNPHVVYDIFGKVVKCQTKELTETLSTAKKVCVSDLGKMYKVHTELKVSFMHKTSVGMPVPKVEKEHVVVEEDI